MKWQHNNVGWQSWQNANSATSELKLLAICIVRKMWIIYEPCTHYTLSRRRTLMYIHILYIYIYIYSLNPCVFIHRNIKNIHRNIKNIRLLYIYDTRHMHTHTHHVQLIVCTHNWRVRGVCRCAHTHRRTEPQQGRFLRRFRSRPARFLKPVHETF